MLLKISSTAPQATNLGFLLHKNPANLHEIEVPFGKAFVFYTEASPERCTACLLLEIDPVNLVRGAQQLEDYVNDRPYVASSYVTVAISRVFGTALARNCQKRPELVGTKLPLEAVVEVIRSGGGAEVLHKLFEPLGYAVETKQIPLDEQFPEWGKGNYFRLSLRSEVTVHDLLTHLYVLLPVLDEEKHYYIGDAEVDKLLRHGEGWLVGHPERTLIVNRYLKRRRSLTDQAFARLLDQEVGEVEATETWTEKAAKAEKDLEPPHNAAYAPSQSGGDHAEGTGSQVRSGSRVRRGKALAPLTRRPCLRAYRRHGCQPSVSGGRVREAAAGTDAGAPTQTYSARARFAAVS